MKRWELMQDGEERTKIAKELCDKITEKMDCDDCPFTDNCSKGHNGIMHYFMEDVK